MKSLSKHKYGSWKKSFFRPQNGSGTVYGISYKCMYSFVGNTASSILVTRILPSEKKPENYPTLIFLTGIPVEV